MKTLFALFTGVALGTAAALWLAARRFGEQQPTATPPVDVPDSTATPVSEEPQP